MSLSSVLKQLHSGLESVSGPSRKVRLEQIGKCFHDLHLTKNDEKIKYDKSPNFGLLSEVTQQVYRELISDSGDQPVLFYPGTRSREVSCYELNIIRAIKTLQIPMDFKFADNEETTHEFSELMGLICKRVHNFFSNRRLNISPKSYTQVLADLASIDLEASPELKRNRDDLLKAIFDRALHDQRTHTWPTYENINLLWANAIHSLRDGGYTSYFSWSTVKSILVNIESKIRSGDFELDKIAARQLFQVYAANYDSRVEFPAGLLEEMQKFLPSFEEETHGSGFEKKIEEEFKQVLPKLKDQYPAINWNACIRYDNPITEFGMEADILFLHPQTGVTVAIQVDGIKFHSFPFYDKTQAKINQKTKFRDYCFGNTGYPHFEISDAEGYHAEKIARELRNLVVFPVYYKTQEKHLQHLAESKENLQQRTENLSLTHTEALENICKNTNRLDGFDKQQQQLAEKTSTLKETADFIFPKEEICKDTLEMLNEIELAIKNTQSELLEKKKNTLQDASVLQSFDKDVSKMAELIEQFAPFVRDLKAPIEALESQIKELDSQAEIASLRCEEVAQALKIAQKKSDEYDAPLKERKESLVKLQKLIGLETEMTIEDSRLLNQFVNDSTLDGLCKKPSNKKTIKHAKKVLNTKAAELKLSAEALKKEIKEYQEKQDCSALFEKRDEADRNHRLILEEKQALVDKLISLERTLKDNNPGKRVLTSFSAIHSKVNDMIGNLENNLDAISIDGEQVEKIEKQLDSLSLSVEELENKIAAQIKKIREKFIAEAKDLERQSLTLGWYHHTLHQCLESDKIAKAAPKEFKEIEEILASAKEMATRKQQEFRQKKAEVARNLKGLGCKEAAMLLERLETSSGFSHIREIEKEFEILREKALSQIPQQDAKDDCLKAPSPVMTHGYEMARRSMPAQPMVPSSTGYPGPGYGHPGYGYPTAHPSMGYHHAPMTGYYVMAPGQGYPVYPTGAHNPYIISQSPQHGYQPHYYNNGGSSGFPPKPYQ
ncbi:MAG: hypothetical protein BGO43_11940 [Gammaproteobacteria bacterium 39-13]|mgnify:CR=1 FL=1|nr:hypothetical protein [Gammaproteobacteria bacterium]OJV85330.1 MAG: hypothetical protein BGO43_11940 [Gammaproteobacteria bacterium 39-13]